MGGFRSVVFGVVVAISFMLAGCAPSVEQLRDDALIEVSQMSGLSSGRQQEFSFMISQATSQAEIERQVQGARDVNAERLAFKEARQEEFDALVGVGWLLKGKSVDVAFSSQAGELPSTDVPTDLVMVLRADGTVEAPQELVNVLGGPRWEGTPSVLAFCTGADCHEWWIKPVEEEPNQVLLHGSMSGPWNKLVFDIGEDVGEVE